MVQLVHIILGARAEVDDTTALICVLFHLLAGLAPTARPLPPFVVNRAVVAVEYRSNVK